MVLVHKTDRIPRRDTHDAPYRSRWTRGPDPVMLKERFYLIFVFNVRLGMGMKNQLKSKSVSRYIRYLVRRFNEPSPRTFIKPLGAIASPVKRSV